MNSYQYGDMNTRYEVTVYENTPDVFTYKINQVRSVGEWGPIPCNIPLFDPEETFSSEEEAKAAAEAQLTEAGLINNE